MALFVAAAAQYSAALVQAQWARLVVLATVGAALYVAVSVFVQRPLLKDITGAFFPPGKAQLARLPILLMRPPPGLGNLAPKRETTNLPKKPLLLRTPACMSCDGTCKLSQALPSLRAIAAWRPVC